MAIRSFIALNVPEECRGRVVAFQSELRSFPEPVKWVRTEGIHLTLKFLGDISESRVAPIEKALAEVLRDRKSFTVQIAGLGAFPRLKQARVLWVGLKESADQLVSLAQSIEDALEPLGFPRERRKFSPHLTLGHVKRRLSGDFIGHFQNLVFDAGSFRVECVHLMQSQLRPAGAVYSILTDLPLK